MGVALQRDGDKPKAFNHLTVSGFGFFNKTKEVKKKGIGEKMEGWSWGEKK